MAIFLLLSLRFAGRPSPAVESHATLIAPVQETPGRITNVRLRSADVLRPRPSVATLIDVPAIDPLPAPIVEIPKPRLPEMPGAAVPIPSIKLDFSETLAAAAPPVPKPALKAAGFQSAGSVSAEPIRATLSPVGSFESVANGTARNATAIVRPSGFSDAAASQSGAPRRGMKASGSFGDSTTEPLRPSAQKRTSAVTSTPVEILSKPKPVYTDEARTKQIEGEVLIELQFSASGETRVLRLVRGLGHGLDETALEAARGIRFRPATRDGGPVDFAAIVHIVFQLAN